MSTPGAQQGLACVIAKGSSPTTVVGQGEFTMTMGGAVVDNTNKSTGGFIEFLYDATTSQQVVFAGTNFYKNEL